MIHSRYPLTAKYQQARRVVKAQNSTRTAVLGDESKNIYSDRYGYYYARPVLSADENGNGLLGPTFYLRANPSAGILPNPGRKVLYKKERGVWTITGPDLNDLEQAGIDSRALEPNDTARGFISLWQIVNLASYSISTGLLVNVYPWQYQTADNIVHFFPGTNAATQVDLTASVPTDVDTHRFTLLVFNVTKHLADLNPLELYDGTAVSLFAPTDRLTINGDLQTCYALLPMDEIVIPIKAYYLQYGQTKIAGASKDIDVRQFINLPSISGAMTSWALSADSGTPQTVEDGETVTIEGGDGVDTVVGATNKVTVSVDATVVRTSAIDNDVTLAADSATRLPTQHAVKSYVDAVAQGLSIKNSVVAATAAALPANSYSNGTSGVGATLTGSSTGVLTIDGQAVALNDRVLVKDEAASSHNGIYVCTTAGAIGVAYVLTRAADMNQAAEIPGAFVFVENGTVNDGAGFVVADPGPFTIGTTAINWTQFSGAGEITAGTGLQKSGNTLSIDATVATLTGAQTLANKVLSQLYLLIGGFKAIFTHAFTADRTVTLPGDANVTLVGVDTTQTLTGKTIDGDDNTFQDIALSAIKTVGANVKRFITRDASGVISDATNPPLDNLQHNHQNAAGGGQLTGAAVNVTAHNAVIGNGASGLTSLAPSTARNVMISDGTDWTSRAAVLADLPTQIGRVQWDYFSSSSTWTKPANALWVRVILISGGSGGGGGRRGASATVRGGGGGGCGGAAVMVDYYAGQLGSTETVTIGTGGSGGTKAAGDNLNGNPGSAGSASYFGGTTVSNSKLSASLPDTGTNGGAQGATGTAAGGAGNTVLHSNFQYYGASGGTGDNGSSAGSGGQQAAFGPGAGGGGGGLNTSNSGTVGFNGSGGSGRVAGFPVQGSGGLGGGGSDTAGASAVTDGSSPQIFGNGGGGGSSGAGGAAANGGNGSQPGGGGGGGGASANGNAAGDGGSGATGGCYVITLCVR